MTEIKLWTLNQDPSGELSADPVETTDHTETEKQLEELIVKSPDLLMQGLKLVGRQTPAGGGALDLLGVNEDGKLVVFELKRGILTRDAVAQVIDYGSYLSTIEPDDLISHISQRSGTGGIDKIEDFNSWYQQQFPNDPDGYSNRPRMVLVGLGADERTKRMVNFLSEGGLDISMITFHGFKKGDTVFLARQVEKISDGGPSPQPKYTKAENIEALKELSIRIGANRLLEKMANLFRKEIQEAYEWPSRSGYSYSLTEQTDQGNPSYRVYVSVYVSEQRREQVQLVFQQRAVQVAKEEFEKLRTEHPERFTKSHGNLQTWVESESDWDSLCNSIKVLLSGIVKGWQEKKHTQMNVNVSDVNP